MLRHAAHRLASRAAAAAGSGSVSRRALATAQVPAESGEDPAFIEAWKKVTNIIEPPQTPMAAMKPRPPTPASIPSKLTVNFVLPYKSEITNKELGKPIEETKEDVHPRTIHSDSLPAKIRIVLKSFNNQKDNLSGLEPCMHKIGLPESRSLYTVLRSPHIDKKSREQYDHLILIRNPGSNSQCT